MEEEMCRAQKKIGAPRGNSPREMVLSVGINFVPTKNLRSLIGIDLLVLLIDWCEGGDAQSTKKVGAPRGNSPREMVLSVGIQILSPLKIKEMQ